MAELIPVMIGSVLDRGNNEVIQTYSNLEYLNTPANAGKRYIPEGYFCAFSGSGDNMKIANDTNAYAIALSAQQFDTMVPNWGQNTQDAKFGLQSFCLRAINVTVAFEQADVGNGAVGDAVFVSANGKATLTGGATQMNVGILKSPIFAKGLDSRGIETGALAYIDFYQPQLSLGAGAKVSKKGVSENV